MINSFWWGSNKTSGRGINWLRWEKLTMRKERGGMGFRHMYGFNLAMLGKQGWKLLTNHDTILTQVFKAKYYPKEGFLGAKLGHNPSYVWRSIHASQVVVKRGLRWRIGNGTNVRIWNQPWLRNDKQPIITTEAVEGMENSTVSELIDHESATWNYQLLQQIFNARDRREILKIPLNLLHTEDECIWNCSRQGTYTVRSAYYLLTQVIIDNSHLQVEGNWQKLWKIAVPQKVKLFLWRSLRGCLPVRSRLVQRGIQCNNKCPHCDQVEENEWHCFFGCNTACDVWKEIEEGQIVGNYTENAVGFVDMVFRMINEVDMNKMARITMVLWTLWWRRRNQRCWNDKIPTNCEVLRRATDALNDWINAQRRNQHKESTTSTQYQWTKPAAGTLKCNVDTACYMEDNAYCVGMCMRDEHGKFLHAYMIKKYGTPEVAEAEVTGIKEALQWIQNNYGVDTIIEVESDCLHAVQAINSRHTNNTEFGITTVMCQNLLSLYNKCQVGYVRRQANRVAHDLAQAARFIASHQVYNYCPPCIATTIMNEMN
ncbi:hypothetical protein P8452_16861 [Trifolium repens]|nr:hypothetical protein P8452_16861 [Trifolium repens]